MKIDIFKKNIFFSHLPRTKVIVPKTDLSLEISPSRILFFNDKEKVEIKCDGIYKEFTIFLNLEKFLIEVRGFSLKGFVKYKIFYKDKKIFLLFEKAYDDFFVFYKKRLKGFLKKPIEIPISFKSIENPSKEKLFLGSNKKNDVELIRRRLDLKEILPILFTLGNSFPSGNFKKGDEDFFCKCEKTFLDVFRVYFEGLFYPRLQDKDFYGIFPDKIKTSVEVFIKNISFFIKRLFFKEEKNKFIILDHFFFKSGRFINVSSSIGIFDIMWSNGKLKKMILHAKENKKILFSFHKKIKSFRVKTSLKDRGSIFLEDQEMKVQKGKIYFFDLFKK